MTMDEFRRWATDRGFRAVGDATLVASHGDVGVTLRLTRHEVRASASRRGAEAPLGSLVPADPYGPKDDAGILDRLELGQSFVARFVRRGAPPPVWLDAPRTAAAPAP